MMTYLELSADNSFYDAFTSALFLPHTDMTLFPSVAAVFEKTEASGQTALHRQNGGMHGKVDCEQLVTYRHLITLQDGLRVVLRPLTPKDRDALIALFTSLPAEETQYFRSNVSNPQLVASWAEKWTTTRSSRWSRWSATALWATRRCTWVRATHAMGEVRMFLARDFRRRGIGSAMLKALIDIGRAWAYANSSPKSSRTSPRLSMRLNTWALSAMAFSKTCS